MRKNERHGKSYSSTYKSWMSMKVRVMNPKATGYEYYGGRGIKICRRWLKSFGAFYADMGERPKNKTLDRIDIDGDYEPGNCRWATKAQQSRNTQRSRYLTFKGQTMVLDDWARKLGVCPKTLRGRIKRGWPLDKVLTLKPLKINGRVITLAERTQ